MGKIVYCPIVGGQCNKIEPEIKVQEDTFFLAEPFHPEKGRKRREHAVKNALKNSLEEKFSEKTLRIADKDPKESFFCDICRLIQSSAYGIVDISGLNPNVLLELGMLFSLGKPVFVLVKRNEEEELREKLPSDIAWKRVISYEEFIDIEEELSTQIQNRPQAEPEPSLAEGIKRALADIDPFFAQKMDTKLQKIEKDQKEGLKNLGKLLKKANLNETIRREEIVIPPSLEEKIDKLIKNLEQMGKIVGFPDDPEIALLRGNWYYHRGDYERASDLYDWAIILRPNFRKAWNNKGVALGKRENHEEAVTCFDKALELKEDFVEAWANKGISFYKLGKYKEAQKCYEEALKINPYVLPVLENFSEALLICGDLHKGLKMAKEVLDHAEKMQDKAVSWFLCISAHLLEKNREKGEREIEKFINYLGKHKKEFEVIKWDFSPLLPVMEEKLKTEDKENLFSLISFLKGKIQLEELEKSIKVS